MGTVPKPPKGYFNILYFASASSFTSKEFDTLPAPLSLQKLFDVLEEKYSGIKDKVLKPGDESAETLIKEGDEVAIIPPVSSG
ncbi:molybdopterin synthase small subunit CnxG [Daldinia vernicosa]|uniref:molybdopterin synthase small subunit CnxG n=1 Tax=Daldinia vernicosa TaxID=114800 RepID=UPI0020085981|nr:molybdopterin synthase small subunit CnxG [Daldinia vernicosa]KAI0846792.1 molybdopterin synthase small subunit CnxG [Daldinia vernicosa]